jgi:hypothetical protein
MPPGSTTPSAAPPELFLLVLAHSLPFWLISALSGGELLRLPVSGLMAFCAALAAAPGVLTAWLYTGTSVLAASPTLKTKRPAMEKRFAAEIADLYARPCSASADARSASASHAA